MKLRFLFSLMLGASLAASAQGYQDGVDNYNADRFDIAKEILTNTINNPSTDKAVSYFYLGNIAFLEKDYNAAKANYEKGFQVNPEYAYNIVGLGQCALQSGDKSGAKKLFDQAIKLNKKNTEVMAAVARAYWNVDPVAYSKDIESMIKKAFKESKNMESAVYMLQGDMAAKRDPGEAAGLYEMAINMDKEKGVVNREGYVKYAHVYDYHNRPLVLEKLEELNQLEPNSGLAQRELAEIYYNDGKYDDAWRSYAKYVQNPNHFRRDEQRYSALAFSAKQYDESIKYAESVLSQDPGNPYAYRLLMVNYDATEKPELAVENGEKLFNSPKLDELTLNDYKVYSRNLMTLDRAPEAVTVLEKGIEAFKDNQERSKELIPMLSKAYNLSGNSDKAIEVQMAFLDSGAADASDYFQAYSSYFAKAREEVKTSPEAAKANFDNALKYLNLAIEKAPNHYYYYYQKGILLYTMNGNAMDNAAAEALETMLTKLDASSEATKDGAKPYLPSTYTLLAIHYSHSDKAKALELVQKGLEVDPANMNLRQQLENLQK